MCLYYVLYWALLLLCVGRHRDLERGAGSFLRIRVLGITSSVHLESRSDPGHAQGHRSTRWTSFIIHSRHYGDGQFTDVLQGRDPNGGILTIYYIGVGESTGRMGGSIPSRVRSDRSRRLGCQQVSGGGRRQCPPLARYWLASHMCKYASCGI